MCFPDFGGKSDTYVDLPFIQIFPWNLEKFRFFFCLEFDRGAFLFGKFRFFLLYIQIFSDMHSDFVP